MSFDEDALAPGLELDASGPVLRLRLCRPTKRNALTRPMMDRLVHHIESAVDRPELRVIVLSAQGDHFCAGADLGAANAQQEIKPRVGDIQRRVPRQAHRLILALLRVQLPVVSLVQGQASGLGAHLVLASDFAIAAQSARLHEPFMRRGFTPDSGGTFLLTRLVGLARARQVLLLGREIDAATAQLWELVHRVVPDSELEAAGDEFANTLAEAPTIALGLTKWMMNAAFDVTAEDALANEAFALELSSRSSDFKEGLRAFGEKRPARFEGR
jgi:2-(1,2-epoxy-1,2-dihydrophenyl)acetyl-CoA isomerase